MNGHYGRRGKLINRRDKGRSETFRLSNSYLVMGSGGVNAHCLHSTCIYLTIIVPLHLAQVQLCKLVTLQPQPSV